MDRCAARGGRIGPIDECTSPREAGPGLLLQSAVVDQEVEKGPAGPPLGTAPFNPSPARAGLSGEFAMGTDSKEQ
jgi:hypothetical protein